MNSKITKQDLFTKLSIVEAKLDRVLDLLQGKKEEAEYELEEFFQYRQSGDLDVQ